MIFVIFDGEGEYEGYGDGETEGNKVNCNRQVLWSLTRSQIKSIAKP